MKIFRRITDGIFNPAMVNNYINDKKFSILYKNNKINILMKECEKHEKDCTSCPYTKECDEYARLKNLIIS